MPAQPPLLHHAGIDGCTHVYHLFFNAVAQPPCRSCLRSHTPRHIHTGFWGWYVWMRRSTASPASPLTRMRPAELSQCRTCVVQPKVPVLAAGATTSATGAAPNARLPPASATYILAEHSTLCVIAAWLDCGSSLYCPQRQLDRALS